MSKFIEVFCTAKDDERIRSTTINVDRIERIFGHRHAIVRLVGGEEITISETYVKFLERLHSLGQMSDGSVILAPAQRNTAITEDEVIGDTLDVYTLTAITDIFRYEFRLSNKLDSAIKFIEKQAEHNQRCHRESAFSRLGESENAFQEFCTKRCANREM
mgnify:CR=1 FL=1